MEPFYHPRRLRPGGAGRRLRQLDVPLRPARDHHREAEPLAVGGPFDVGRSLIDPGRLGDRALGIHGPDEDLGAGRLALREVGQPSPVGGPDRIGPLHQEAKVRPIRIHDPESGFPTVLHPVHAPAGKHDLIAVGRNPRRPGGLVVEIPFDGEERIGRFDLRGGDGGRKEDERQGHGQAAERHGTLSDGAMPHDSAPRAARQPNHIPRAWFERLSRGPAPVTELAEPFDRKTHEEMGFHHGWATALDQLAALMRPR